MAAYAALVSLMNDLELIPNHPIHSFSFDKKQIASLSQSIRFLVDFLESYDSHGCSRGGGDDLEIRIASAAYAAHDVIESNVVGQIHDLSTLLGTKATSYSFLDFVRRRAIQFGSTLLGEARSPYFLPDLHKLIDNMEYVKREAKLFKEKSGLKAVQPTYAVPASSEPLNYKNVMVGFDAAVLRLKDMLVGDSSNQQIIIPIVGMGGIGKTTLAKNVYQHPHVEQRFDIRLWATVSEQYNVGNILIELLVGIRNSTADIHVSEIGEELRKKKLWGRRYLIVLDDMWSLDSWNEIQMYFPNNGNGSRIILTTRLSNLTVHLSSFSSFTPSEMELLDNNKSWELFCGNAFGEEDCPVELEEIGNRKEDSEKM